MIQHDHTSMFYVVLVSLRWAIAILSKFCPVGSMRPKTWYAAVNIVSVWNGFVDTYMVRDIAFRDFSALFFYRVETVNL